MTSSQNSVIFTHLLHTLRVSLLVLLILLPPSSHSLSAPPTSEKVVRSTHSSVSSTTLHKQGSSHNAPASSPDVQFSQIKTIKVPSGTVKCSCQTIPDDEFSDLAPENGKSIEIEIHNPNEGEGEEGGIEEMYGSASDRLSVKVKKKPIRNSFTLEGEEYEEESDSSEDRLFSTEEPPSFLSFLSNLYKDDLLAKAQWRQEEEEEKSEEKSDHISPSNGDGSYKAFRSSELDLSPSFDHSTQDQIDKYHKTEEKKEQPEPYFSWDFIYGHNNPPPTLKKREFLYLGSAIDSFKGPRRKRRRRSLIGPRSKPIVFVYPDGYNPPVEDAEVSTKTAPEPPVVNETLPEHEIQVRSDPGILPVTPDVTPMDKDMLAQKMHESMKRAWVDYGTDGLHNPKRTYVPPPPPPPASSLVESEVHQEESIVLPPPPPPHPANVALPYHQQIAPYHVQTHQYYRPPRPFLFIDRIFNPFQPMGSEWDKQVRVYSQGPPRPPEPGLFSRFLASYIDFEVNNHETADIMRRVVFALFVGFLIVGWISLGVFLGVIPLKKWLGVTSIVGKDGDNIGKEFTTREANLADLTDKILLALDVDWLKRLEERVMGSGGYVDKLGGAGSPNGRKIPIQVFCCILPDEQVNGMVECQVSKKGQGGGKKTGGKKSAFKCISDLIYNFQFGPKEDSAGGENDNVVNFKGKAEDFNNNDNVTVVP